MHRFVLAVGAGALLASVIPAPAQTLYRYVDTNGRVHYSDKPLTELSGRPVDQLGRTGAVIKHTPAAPSAQERAMIEAERRRDADNQRSRENEQRRDLALLATYSSAKEIDEAHAFAVREPQALANDTEAKLAAAETRRDKAKGALAGAKPADAASLQRELSAAEIEARALTQLLAAKRREIQTLDERFSEDRRRFAELVRLRAQSSQASRETTSPAGSSAASAGGASPAAPRR